MNQLSRLVTAAEPVPAGQLHGRPLRRSISLITLSWVFGSVWATAIGGAPFCVFARDLHASEFQIGLLASLPFLASLVSMPASVFTERTGSRKAIFQIATYAQRLLWLPIALLPLWLMRRGGGESAAIVAFMGLVLLMYCSGAAGGPAWLSWMADIVPDRVHGKYFARRRQWGILSAIPTALLVGWLLDHFSSAARPASELRICAMIFMASAVFGFMDIHLFRYVPDVPMPPKRRASMLRLMGQPLKDRQFLLFGGFVATLTFAVSFMGQFVTFYLMDRVQVTGTGIQMMLLVAPLLTQLLVLPAWGHAADRMGKKPVMAIASLGLAPVGLGWCFMGPGLHWLGYVLSIAGAAFWTGIEVANLNFVLEFSGSGDGDNAGSSYVAMNSVIINIAGCLGGLCAGVIAGILKDWTFDLHLPGLHVIGFYEVLFALSGVMRLVAAVAFLPALREPEAGSAAETIRFMGSNIYNNLFNAVLMPLRVLRVRSDPPHNAKLRLRRAEPPPIRRAA